MFGKEKNIEKIKDDIIEEKIRKMRKTRNLERRPQKYNIENTRRKIELGGKERRLGQAW